MSGRLQWTAKPCQAHPSVGIVGLQTPLPVKRSRNRPVIKTACLQCPLQGATRKSGVVLRANGLESDPDTLSYDLLAVDRAKRSGRVTCPLASRSFGAFDFLDDDCFNDRWTDVIGITAPIVGSLNLPHIDQHIRRLCHWHRDTCAQSPRNCWEVGRISSAQYALLRAIFGDHIAKRAV